jgi:hypothetical protein
VNEAQIETLAEALWVRDVSGEYAKYHPWAGDRLGEDGREHWRSQARFLLAEIEDMATVLPDGCVSEHSPVREGCEMAPAAVAGCARRAKFPTPWRLGRRVSRNIYDANGEPILMAPNEGTAERIIRAVNARCPE